MAEFAEAAASVNRDFGLVGRDGDNLEGTIAKRKFKTRSGGVALMPAGDCADRYQGLFRALPPANPALIPVNPSVARYYSLDHK